MCSPSDSEVDGVRRTITSSVRCLLNLDRGVGLSDEACRGSGDVIRTRTCRITPPDAITPAHAVWKEVGVTALGDLAGNVPVTIAVVLGLVVAII